eukprot:CAMPEP_0177588188 /NCGR_PEP_ID=MMETSP0419_2-20121207/6089_1 /TAXON_ID=582737 /ORGANISM="Tetraselmis sp., Strain GSL018" /LENGTH=692 /DNA_ID=CAMNT_0019078363 /DNA_START=162 /DNA_END=2237 /DNA_ORIENTATION=+
MLPQGNSSRERAKGWSRTLQRLRDNDAALTVVIASSRGSINSDEDLRSLAKALQKNTVLLTLDLEGQRIGPLGGKALADALLGNNTLRKLNLEGNQIDVDGATAIAAALNCNTALTELNLAGNWIRNGGAKALAETLQRNSSLRSLNLWGNNFGRTGGKAILEAVQVNTALQKLNIGGNSIGTEGVAALEGALQRNTVLKELNLLKTMMRDPGVELLARALARNHTLERLHLGDNGIKSGGTRALAEALRDNSTLKELYLSGNQIDNDAARNLLGALTKDTGLIELDLGDAIPEEEVRNVLSKLRRIPPTPEGGTDRLPAIPFQELRLQRVIGTGSSKTVHSALWHDEEVAVLILRSGSARSEAAVFERLGRHPQLTRLLGTSRDPYGSHVLVTELARKGSLHTLLGDLVEEGRKASNLVLLQCAMQVCEGMLKIAEEGLIHRDLALRNVLVFDFDPDDPKRVAVKVTDYGLTREAQYYYSESDELPFRWMSPEAIVRGRWSEKSDVWAFGVLLWELWSAAMIPFHALGNADAAKRTVEGHRLEKTDECPDSIYELMKQCWETEASNRPTFIQLRVLLQDLHVELASALTDEAIPDTDVTTVVDPGTEAPDCDEKDESEDKEEQLPGGDTSGDQGNPDVPDTGNPPEGPDREPEIHITIPKHVGESQTHDDCSLCSRPVFLFGSIILLLALT